MTQQMPGPAYPPPPPNHPQATSTLVLGILGLVVCAVIAPFAWSMGSKTVQEIDASGGRWGGRSEANSGRILGMVGTILLVGGLALVVLLFLFVAVFGAFTVTAFHSTQTSVGG
jgi:uncharacterized membrane protein YjgN (DUF898 family)